MVAVLFYFLDLAFEELGFFPAALPRICTTNLTAARISLKFASSSCGEQDAVSRPVASKVQAAVCLHVWEQQLRAMARELCTMVL